MKVFKLLLLLSFFSLMGYAQTTPWATGTITTQTRLSSGSPQIRWLWSSTYVYSLQDSILKYAVTVSPGTITSSPSNGDNYASLNGFISLFSKTNNPTGSLTGGTQYELTTSNKTHNLSYSYGRTNLNTNSIASAVINPGSLNVFTSSPTQGSSNSGTQSVTTVANTNTTYTLHISTGSPDNKTADYTTSDTFSPQSYRGFVTDTTNIGVFGTYNDATQIRPLAYGFTSNTSMSFNAGSASGTYLVYVYPASFGALVSFTINGLAALPAMKTVTRSFTNASGYTQLYRIYYSANAQTTSGYPVTAN